MNKMFHKKIKIVSEDVLVVKIKKNKCKYRSRNGLFFSYTTSKKMFSIFCTSRKIWTIFLGYKFRVKLMPENFLNLNPRSIPLAYSAEIRS